MKGNALIKNASQVVTCSGFKAKHGKEMSDLHIITDGAVLIEEGIIKAVGKTNEIIVRYSEDVIDRFDGSNLSDNAPEIIDATGKTVLPGFVDSHTHFVFGGYREEEFSWRLRGDSYMEIMQRDGGIISTVNETRKATMRELMNAGKRRLDSMLSFGVTTAEGKSGYGLDRDTEIRQLEIMRNLDRDHPVDVVRTFLGAHAVPADYKGKEDEFIDYMIMMSCLKLPNAILPNSVIFSVKRMFFQQISQESC